MRDKGKSVQKVHFQFVHPLPFDFLRGCTCTNIFTRGDKPPIVLFGFFVKYTYIFYSDFFYTVTMLQRACLSLSLT